MDSTFNSTFDNTFGTASTLTEPCNMITFSAAKAAVMGSVVRAMRLKTDGLVVVAEANPNNKDHQVNHLKAESKYDLVKTVKVIRIREF